MFLFYYFINPEYLHRKTFEYTFLCPLLSNFFQCFNFDSSSENLGYFLKNTSGFPRMSFDCIRATSHSHSEIFAFFDHAQVLSMPKVSEILTLFRTTFDQSNIFTCSKNVEFIIFSALSVSILTSFRIAFYQSKIFTWIYFLQCSNTRKFHSISDRFLSFQHIYMVKPFDWFFFSLSKHCLHTLTALYIRRWWIGDSYLLHLKIRERKKKKNGEMSD